MDIDLVADRPDGDLYDVETGTFARGAQLRPVESGPVNPKHNLATLRAAMAGDLDNSDYQRDEIWGLQVPANGPKEATQYLHPIQTWQHRDEFCSSAKELIQQIALKLVQLGLADTLKMRWHRLSSLLQRAG